MLHIPRISFFIFNSYNIRLIVQIIKFLIMQFPPPRRHFILSPNLALYAFSSFFPYNVRPIIVPKQKNKWNNGSLYVFGQDYTQKYSAPPTFLSWLMITRYIYMGYCSRLLFVQYLYDLVKVVNDSGLHTRKDKSHFNISRHPEHCSTSTNTLQKTGNWSNLSSIFRWHRPDSQ